MFPVLFRIGDFEITTLSDGTLGLDVKKLLTNTSPVRVDQLLKRSFLTNPVDTSVNAFLVNTGTKLVLIDAGTGNLFGPTLAASRPSPRTAIRRATRSTWSRARDRRWRCWAT